jgi:MFS transporter, FSR family, fosmidomycin resistance protein
MSKIVGIIDVEKPNMLVALLSLCHLVNDSYMSLFPPLVPLIMVSMNLDMTAIGLLTTIFAVTSSLSQLAIGQLTDRFGGRFFIVLGPLLAGAFMSLIGLIHNYYVLAVAMSIAGLGVAAFHPPASAVAGSISKDKSGLSMSLFVLGGNLGIAVMPLMAVPLVERYGLQSTPVLFIPAIFASAIIYFKIQRFAIKKASHHKSTFLKTVKAKPLQFASLIGTVAVRALAFHGFITFMPKFFNDSGFTPIQSGAFLSILTFSGAIGGLLGGYLSDHLGRKPVIIGSLIVAAPFLNLVLMPKSALTSIWVGLSGIALMTSFSVTVVSAQEIFPDNKAVASSLALGFGLGLGGLGVGAVGYFASTIGLAETMRYLTVLPALAALLAFGLPGNKQQRSLEGYA